MSTCDIFTKAVGRTIQSIDDTLNASTLCYVKFEDGSGIHFGHWQECCESVGLEDGEDDLRDLVGGVIISIEMVDNADFADDHRNEWTFYKFTTTKGYATLRFCADAESYYATDVRATWVSGEAVS